MSAATDNRKWQCDGAGLTRDQIANALNGPIAASTTLYTGTIVGQLYSDTATHPALYSFVGDGTMRAVGICTVGADSNTPSGQPANSRPPRVIAAVGMFVDKNAGGGSAFSTANLFGPTYGVDNQTVSALPTDGPIIGQFVGIDFVSGLPLILVDPVTAVSFQLGIGPGIPASRRARLASTSNLNLATTGLAAIDGVTPAAFDVILVAGQTTASQNGLYYASAGAWQRVPGVPIVADMVMEVSEGSAFAHSTWKCTTQGAIVVGTTSFAFYPKTVKGTSGAMTAGSITISNVWLLAGAVIMLTENTAGGTVGTLKAAAASRTAGAGNGSFIIASSSGTDTSTVDYLIVNW